MSFMREASFDLGMIQGLDFPDSRLWCDLDFDNRAYRQSFKFCPSTKAICCHRHYNLRSLDADKKRVKTAESRAGILLQRYPELLVDVPMFYHKTPITQGQDLSRLIAHKFTRLLASIHASRWSMKQIVKVLEKRYLTGTLLLSLYHYSICADIYQSYREGIIDFELARAEE
jgi:hypothetical protein